MAGLKRDGAWFEILSGRIGSPAEVFNHHYLRVLATTYLVVGLSNLLGFRRPGADAVQNIEIGHRHGHGQGMNVWNRPLYDVGAAVSPRWFTVIHSKETASQDRLGNDDRPRLHCRVPTQTRTE